MILHCLDPDSKVIQMIFIVEGSPIPKSFWGIIYKGKFGVGRTKTGDWSYVKEGCVCRVPKLLFYLRPERRHNGPYV